MNYPPIVLSPEGVKKVLQRKLWLTLKDCIDIQKIKTSFEPGSLVSLYSKEKYFLAQAYINPYVFYAIKILTFEKIEINKDFFKKCFQKALELRKILYPKERVFRLIHAEGDYLPGLVVDIYEKIAVLQIYTYGMERLKNFIVEALRELLDLESIVFKNDFERRKDEELPLYVNWALKKPPENYLVEIDDIKFLIPLLDGQKTGFFLDQRENRHQVSKICLDLTVIDAFCYLGAFAFYALKGGAKRAFLLDRSSKALDLALEIANLNGWKDRVIPLEGDVFNLLKGLKEVGDILILDPPAFIKAKGDLDKGIEKYKNLYSLGFNHFNSKKGFLALFSCSHFLTKELFEKIIQEIITKKGILTQKIFSFSQAPDHPINPQIKETEYLKGALFKIN